ncbi:MAG: DUF4321 domain-containing protein [Ruminococcus sp.]|nr:DUF4321 domain-containing protein [Oscillospiraceae bacterium]
MKKTLLMSLFIIAAIVIGGLLGDAVEGIQPLEWLAYSKSFAFEPGTFLNLDVLALTFGIRFQANVAQLICCLIALFAYYKLAPKLVPGK